MPESTWMLLTVLGPIVLACAIAYALLKRRRLSGAEKAAQHEAIDRLYDEDVPGMEMPEPEERHRREMDEPRTAADLAVSDHRRQRN